MTLDELKLHATRIAVCVPEITWEQFAKITQCNDSAVRKAFEAGRM